jgi:hypothetical protein
MTLHVSVTCPAQLFADPSLVAPYASLGREDLMAFTVNQPFTEAIADGSKPYENRGWRPTVEGRWLALHAGLKAYKFASVESFEHIRSIWPNCPRCIPGAPWKPFPQARGAIVALVWHHGTHRPAAAQRIGPPEAAAWAFGPQCWWFPLVWRLEAPIRDVRGYQGLWRVDRKHRYFLDDQIDRAAAAFRAHCKERERQASTEARSLNGETP